MTWIETIEPEHAEGKLADIYRAIGSARGGVAEVHRVQSLHPRALLAHLELYKAVVLGRASLSRIERERIAVVVSRQNRCEYCVQHHAEALRQAGDDAALVGALEAGELPETLGEASRALLEWARMGASTPGEASETHLKKLRGLGWEDRALLDAGLTVSYFSFVNRLVLLFGVDLEARFDETCGPSAPSALTTTDR